MTEPNMTEPNMPEPNKNSIAQGKEESNIEKNTVRLDPGTLILILVVLLFIPLVLTGLIAQ